jgi:hypothetical protein
MRDIVLGDVLDAAGGEQLALARMPGDDLQLAAGRAQRAAR